MADRYAVGTDVPVERTRTELERLLTRHGATGFIAGWDNREAVSAVMFRMADRMIRLTVPRVDPEDPAVKWTPGGRARSVDARQPVIAAEDRRRWRALLLIVKARLVAVDDGVTTLERAFLAEIVLPDGSTVGDWLGPQLDTAYAAAQMPALLPGVGAPELTASREAR